MLKFRRYLRWFIALFFIALSITWWLLPTTKAYACTQPVGGHIRYSIEKRVDQAQMIAEGLVIEVYAESYEKIALIEVTAYYKGSGPSLISVAGYGDGAQCRSYIIEGQQQIFYLRQNADGSLWASYGSAGDAYISATDESRDAVINHMGRQPEPPSLDQEPNLLNLTLAQSQATSIVAQRETSVAQRSQTPFTLTYTPTLTINRQTATAFKETFYTTFNDWRTQQARPLDTSATATWWVEQEQYYATGTEFASDFATSQAREQWLTTTPTPPFNLDDVYGPGGATAMPLPISPTTPPARTWTPSATIYIPLSGSTLATMSFDQYQTIEALSRTPAESATPYPLPSTDAAVNRAMTASPSPSMAANVVEAQNAGSPSGKNDENNDVAMFILGFLAATALFVTLGVGFWIGRRLPTNPPMTD
jgi:hypothetical protein